ncbi:molecular chaperone [Pelosinus sp. sgz500959]|uniref:TorD/DmsD family molecular chaperone n=1 Tax=Pelosinus sp. sgz500959 TaxID=3242472 RepID=UPI003671F939
MLQNHKFNMLKELETRYCIYSLFKKYYQGDWQEIGQALQAASGHQNDHWQGAEPVFNRLLKKLSEMSLVIDENSVYEYNKLFVGPGKLLAPPFESSYRNKLGLVMQEETLAVRNFYKKIGVEVKAKNSIPDDHLVLELEFICYLLAQAAKKTESEHIEAPNEYLILYKLFFIEHIKPWLYEHCNDVLQHAVNPFCLGMAEIFEEFLQGEERKISI